jgi:nitrite reductase (NADH) small subunit
VSEVEVGALEDIPVGEGRTYAVEDAQVAVFRLRDGTLRAIDAVCPHRGGPLADGLIDERVVVCPLHGHTFDMCTGAEAGGELSVRSYPVSAVEGLIRLTVTEG